MSLFCSVLRLQRTIVPAAPRFDDIARWAEPGRKDGYPELGGSLLTYL